MNSLRSLRLRIAATVFALELIMLSLVLWQTLGYANQSTRQQISQQDHTITNLLEEAAHTALLTTEFTELAPLFEHTLQNPHISETRLYDRRERVVVASSPALMGQTPESETTLENTYWLRQTIESTTGRVLGYLHIRFSDRELSAAYQKTLTLGISIAISGMLIIAFAGLTLGHFLTRRLEQVIRNTQRFASGDTEARCTVSGNDEITDLSTAFNQMAEQINSSFARIQHLAYHDALTGLSNRIDFDTRLDQALKSAHQGTHTHALLYMDLDQFKIVNDTCGHDAGDQLLVELASSLAKKLRTRDTIARLGGDEFGVLLENCHLEEAQRVAEKLRQQVEAFRFSWEGRDFRIGASIGLVVIDESAKSSKQLLSLADMACYAAKDMGRNTIRVAVQDDDDIQHRASEMQWVAKIHQALEAGNFQLHVQPIAVTGEPNSRPYAEFLLRMLDGQSNLIAPGRFIPAAERFNLMPAIDRHVVELVFTQLKRMPQQQRPKLSFINLSGASLGEDGLFEHIASQLRQHAVPAAQVCFEITETVAVNNHHQALRFIKRVRELGCHFALDDFGSGMCSFTYLKSLPVDFVKIDGSFIHHLRTHSVDRSIVVAINQIAHEAGLKTIAEFVEDEATLAALQELGVDYAQGYLIDRPQPLEEAFQKVG